MSLWLFKFDQPRGFDAMRAETKGFTRIASHVRVNVKPGDCVVIFNIAEKHVAAVVTVRESATKRSEGDDLERWPYAFGTRPEMLSSRGKAISPGPQLSPAGRRRVRRAGGGRAAQPRLANLRPVAVSDASRAKRKRSRYSLRPPKANSSAAGNNFTPER
jgi:hypothetical protein